jgi:hypothetical protein
MRKLKGWQKILLVAGAGVVLPILSCSQRSLVLIDVHAPQGVAYSNVSVIITVEKDQPTTFDKVSFDTTGVFHAGVYIPSDMTGAVALHADVDQSNCLLGSGDASTNVTSEGETTTAVPVPITPATTPCVSGTGGSAATGGASGAGGLVGAGGSLGSGGSGGLTGAAGAAGAVGAGGVNGSGGAAGMGGKGGVTGSGGAAGAGGSVGGGGHNGSGSGGVNGTGGSPTTGAGGSPTTGAGGSPTTGAGGSPTSGSGGSPMTGSGGITGKGGSGGSTGGSGGVTGSGGVPTTGSGGGGGCNCPANFVCPPGTTTCVCSQTDAEACASVACGSTTNLCQQTVSCPNTCPVGYSCFNNFCRQLTTTGCGGDIVTTGTGLVAGTAAAPICPQ